MPLISPQHFCLYFCCIFTCVKGFFQPLEYSLWEWVNTQKYTKAAQNISAGNTLPTISSLTTACGDRVRVSSQLHRQMQPQPGVPALLSCTNISPFLEHTSTAHGERQKPRWWETFSSLPSPREPRPGPAGRSITHGTTSFVLWKIDLGPSPPHLSSQCGWWAAGGLPPQAQSQGIF